MHAAVKSGEVECLRLIFDHVLSKQADGLSLLRLLAASPDYEGYTPISLAAQSSDIGFLDLMSDVGIDLRRNIIYYPEILQVATDVSKAFLLSPTGKCHFITFGFRLVPI